MKKIKGYNHIRNMVLEYNLTTIWKDKRKNFILKFSRLPYQLEPEKGLEDKIQVIVSG